MSQSVQSNIKDQQNFWLVEKFINFQSDQGKKQDFNKISKETGSQQLMPEKYKDLRIYCEQLYTNKLIALSDGEILRNV